MHRNTEVNPYESPREACIASPRSNAHAFIFFLINFTLSVAIAVTCLAAIAEAIIGSGSPYSFIGGLFVGPAAAAFALAEWFLFIGKRKSLQLPLGFACGAFAAFVAFGFVANVFEALGGRRAPDAPPNPPNPAVFMLIFSSICLPIIAYNVYCCWYRLRDARQRA